MRKLNKKQKTRSSNRPKSSKKPASTPQKQYLLKEYAEQTLGSGNLRLAVHLPDGEDLNEWLAVNSKPDFLSISSGGFLFFIFAKGSTDIL